MSRQDRERAQRISDYVDGLVVNRREAGLRAFKAADREFGELSELARTLNAVGFREPADFRGELRGWLPEMARSSAGAWTKGVRWRGAAGWVRQATQWNPPLRWAARTAFAMTPVLALGAALVWQFAGVRTLSAAEVLGRADDALSRLVHEDQILHRRWKVTDRVKAADGTLQVVRESTSDEWMTGSDFSLVAGRIEADGRVYLAYASAREGDDVRPRVYFAPGFSNEPLGLLSVEPSRREFQEALTRFDGRDREVLAAYLERSYIFEPISGERRFNRMALDAGAGNDAPLPRIRVSLREETLPSGTDVFVLRVVDPARVRFRWKSQGAPVAWLERREMVRYIARDTYLSLKAEETYENETGRRVYTTRELIEVTVGDAAADGNDPFVLPVAAGTPVRRQSAVEQLTAVAAVLGQISETASR